MPCSPEMCLAPQLYKSACELPSCEIPVFSINSPSHLAGCMIAQPPTYPKLQVAEGDGENFQETAFCGASGLHRVSQARGAGFARGRGRACLYVTVVTITVGSTRV